MLLEGETQPHQPKWMKEVNCGDLGTLSLGLSQQLLLLDDIFSQD